VLYSPPPQCTALPAGEFGCTVMCDVIMMVAIVLWMVTVSWWVFRHWVGQESLHSILGESLADFRAALGDRDRIHLVQFEEPSREDYCDPTLYLVAASTLSIGWLLLFGALVVFLVDKVLSKLVCCNLCGDNTRRVCPGTLEEEEEELHGRGQLRPHAALRGMEP